jgi:very-short-patch-repair endonuclease
VTTGHLCRRPLLILAEGGCPKCKKKTENFVFKTLKDSGYDVGKGTNILINKGVQLRYDIVMYITDTNGGIIKVIVEVDGGQHFFSVSAFRQTLEEIQQNDMVKQQYAIDNDYHMIRIDQQYIWDQQIKHITEWFDRLSKSLKNIQMQEELERDERYITDDIDKYSHFVDSQKQSCRTSINKCKGQNTLHTYYQQI